MLTWAGGALLASGCQPGFDLKISPTASSDEVLDALHVTDLELASALSNHGPMAPRRWWRPGFPSALRPSPSSTAVSETSSA